MCGIVGYIGERKVAPVLIKGLKRLEYRGYDSAGIAYLDDNDLKVIKSKGRLSILEGLVAGIEAKNTIGIGHTRWATHGEPSDENSHPQTNEENSIAVVHNGIIENYIELKEKLTEKGIKFTSQTDTEVIAHLINYYYNGGLVEAVAKAISKLEGSYAIGVISKHHPDSIVCARKDSPLIIGLGKGENFIASDIPAVLPYTKDVYLLEDKEIALLEKNSVTVYDKTMTPVEKEVFKVEWDIEQAEKGGYAHFMLKEIHEEPQSLLDTLSQVVKNGKPCIDSLNLKDEFIKKLKKIYIVACGTAYHAGVVGKYILERSLRICVEVDIASEFRYRNSLITKDDLMIIISQSGETADTIAAMREAKSRGAFCLAIVNSPGSTISREADGVFYTRAGMEIAVASTKAYDTQLMAFYVLSAAFSKIRGLVDDKEAKKIISSLTSAATTTKMVLDLEEKIKRIAAFSLNQRNVFFIGRGLDYALALESSLKLKEISYIHSEAYAAGELKHGTIALIEKGTLVFGILTQKDLIDKTISNLQEVKARGAYIIVLAVEGAKVEGVADRVITLPKIEDEIYYPLLGVIPMQLFAYYVSVLKGCDVDKPRNLAKSVTVE